MFFPHCYCPEVTQQCLAAPTRSEIDAAHTRRQWMDIGIPSIRNLFRIKAERMLWIAIGITSVLLHLGMFLLQFSLNYYLANWNISGTIL